MSTTTTTGPRIYVASLADYNNGTLHGEWIDADQDADAIGDAIRAMLARSPLAGSIYGPAEEYAIHDYEGFGGIRLGEWEPVELVSALAEAIAEHGDAFVAWYLDGSAEGVDAGDLARTFQDLYRGEWDNLGEYAAELYADCYGEVPAELAGYVDWQTKGRDLWWDGAFVAVAAGPVELNNGGRCYIFSED
jgi:antirestriction protein